MARGQGGGNRWRRIKWEKMGTSVLVSTIKIKGKKRKWAHSLHHVTTCAGLVHPLLMPSTLPDDRRTPRSLEKDSKH